MNYEEMDEEKLIKKINDRNKDLIFSENKKIENFQEYKRNEDILKDLNKKRASLYDEESRVKSKNKQVNNFDAKKYFTVVFSMLSSALFIFFLFSFITSNQKLNNEKEINVENNQEKLLNKNEIIFNNTEDNFILKNNHEENIENTIIDFEDELNDKKPEDIDTKEIEKVEIVEEIKKTIIVSTELRGAHLGYFYAYENDKLVKSGEISSGREHYETPVGKFSPLGKERYYSSSAYRSTSGTNNMNYMVRLTWDGIAFHEGSPDQISHGCIHIAPAEAPWIFQWTDEKTDVYITEKKINKDNSLVSNIYIINQSNDAIKSERLVKKEEIEYWDNGNYKSILKYEGGYLHGVQLYYWENGFIKEEKFYKKGRWNGRRIEYWDNGKMMRDFLWQNDKLQTGKSWDRNGNLVFDFDIRETEPVKINYGE